MQLNAMQAGGGAFRKVGRLRKIVFDASGRREKNCFDCSVRRKKSNVFIIIAVTRYMM